MQNKPNFQKSQMNVNIYNTTDYENKYNWTLGENKPNSNPIKPNFRKAKMNVNSLITKDYRKNDAFAVQKNKPNSNPISVKPKMSANSLLAKDYENETAFRLQKNKPNQSQFQKQKSEDRSQKTEVGRQTTEGRGHKDLRGACVLRSPARNKFHLTPKVGKSIIAVEICDSVQYIMSDIKRSGQLRRLITLLLLSFAVPAALAAPEEITASSLKELIKVARKVSAGKTIIVAPGVYELPQQLNFKGRGTAKHPVVLKALEPGKTVFCGSGRMRIENSSWVRVEGFLFKGTGGIYCEKSEHIQITENRFLMEDTEDKSEKLYWVQFKFSRYVRVDHCEFGRRSSAGSYIHFSPGNRYARIDHNYFHDYKELGANDGSSVYLHGDGKWAHYAIVERNLFIRCNGEHELICIKSHRNVIRGNTFLNCKGAISIRDGNYNDVYNNIFLASDEPKAGAVRFHGKFNVFANNYLEGIAMPIECCWGDTDPPHMADELGPGKLAFAYRASPNNLVAHNSFVRCKVVFHWYKKGIKLETITPRLKKEALEPFLIDFWEKETSSHRLGDIVDPRYPPSGWYIYNNLILNTPQLVSTKTVHGASLPVREKDFRWIGNISSKGIDTGQWRSLHAHQLELVDLGTTQGADGVLELRKRRPVGCASELAAFWAERNGDDENLKAVLSLNEFTGTEKDNTLEVNDVGTSW